LPPSYAAAVTFDLPQVNVSRLLAPIDSPMLAEFMAALDEVNAEGDAAAGFRWRLQTEDGNATVVRAFGWDVGDSHGVIVNLTTWASVQALGDFVFSGQHLQVMRRPPTVVRAGRRAHDGAVVGAGRLPALNRRRRSPGAAPAPPRTDPRGLHLPHALPQPGRT
jgi:hypothetical protein